MSKKNRDHDAPELPAENPPGPFDAQGNEPPPGDRERPPDVPQAQQAPAGDEGQPPRVAPRDADWGPVPRILDNQPAPAGQAPRDGRSDRAPPDSGLKRFKIRCDNYQGRPPHYVLAHDEKEARECYLEATGLDDFIEGMRADDPANADKVPAARLVVRELPD